MADRELRRPQLTADWLRGVAAVGGAVIVIRQQGGGEGGVSADDELQTVWRLCDQRDDEAAVKVSGPHVVNLRHMERRKLMFELQGFEDVFQVLGSHDGNMTLLFERCHVTRSAVPTCSNRS